MATHHSAASPIAVIDTSSASASAAEIIDPSKDNSTSSLAQSALIQASASSASNPTSSSSSSSASSSSSSSSSTTNGEKQSKKPSGSTSKFRIPSFKAKAERQLILTMQKMREVFAKDKLDLVTEDPHMLRRQEALKFVDSTVSGVAVHLEMLEKSFAAFTDAQNDLSRYLVNHAEKVQPDVGEDMANVGEVQRKVHVELSMLNPTLHRAVEKAKTFKTKIVPDTYETIRLVEKERVTYDAFRQHMKELERSLGISSVEVEIDLQNDPVESGRTVVSPEDLQKQLLAKKSEGHEGRQAEQQQKHQQQLAHLQDLQKKKYSEAMHEVGIASQRYEQFRKDAFVKIDLLAIQRVDLLQSTMVDIVRGFDECLSKAVEMFESPSLE